MASNQLCQWVINPYAFSGPNDTGGLQRTVVLEFTASDLIGASITVYDGSDNTGQLLWNCNGCQNVPRPIISISSSLYVVFSSAAGGVKGMGFSAVYWGN